MPRSSYNYLDALLAFRTEEQAKSTCNDWRVVSGSQRAPRRIIIEKNWDRSGIFTPKIQIPLFSKAVPYNEYEILSQIDGVVDSFFLVISALEFPEYVLNCPNLISIGNREKAEKSPDFYEFCRPNCEWMTPHWSPTIAGTNYTKWRSVYKIQNCLDRTSPINDDIQRIENLEKQLEYILSYIKDWSYSNEIEKRKLYSELEFYLDIIKSRSKMDNRFAISLINSLTKIAWDKSIGIMIVAPAEDEIRSSIMGAIDNLNKLFGS